MLKLPQGFEKMDEASRSQALIVAITVELENLNKRIDEKMSHQDFAENIYPDFDDELIRMRDQLNELDKEFSESQNPSKHDAQQTESLISKLLKLFKK